MPRHSRFATLGSATAVPAHDYLTEVTAIELQHVATFSASAQRPSSMQNLRSNNICTITRPLVNSAYSAGVLAPL